MNEMSPAQREGFVETDRRVPRPVASAPEPSPPTRAAAPEPAPTPAPAPEPVPEPMIEDVWPIKVKLVHSKNVRNFRNEYVDALTFRAPTGGDINRCGNPCRVNQDGDVIIDERKMTLMMASLSGVLSPVIETLDTRDWNSAAYRLRPFFLPEPGLAWV